jgi:hypothetical protein
MEIKHRIMITLVIGVVLIASFYVITEAITKYTGFFVSNNADAKSDFKICLSEKDITLYINTANTANTLKNIQLIDYLDSIKITNCISNNNPCLNKDISSFPSWIINENKLNKDITLEELKQFSGCK